MRAVDLKRCRLIVQDSRLIAVYWSSTTHVRWGHRAIHLRSMDLTSALLVSRCLVDHMTFSVDRPDCCRIATPLGSSFLQLSVFLFHLLSIYFNS